MARLMVRKAVLVFCLMVCLTLLIGLTGVDVLVSGLAYVDSRGWVWQDFPLCKFLYHVGPVASLVLGLAGLLLALRGCLWSSCARSRRCGAFIFLLVALGPGLTVHGLLKDNWGRPRPRQVREFGGDMAYREAWQFGGGSGQSFPSGHAAGAFAFVAPYFLMRRRDRVSAHAWLIGGGSYGAAMGAARIAQGGHYLTDIIWAGGVVYLLGEFLAAAMQIDAAAETAVPRVEGGASVSLDPHQGNARLNFPFIF